jgi:hypothetical protein
MLENIQLSLWCAGNGFNSATIENYRDFITRDIARIFIEGLRLKGW